MEQNDTPQPDYLKGYNEGYLMQKHMPDLTDKLINSLGDSDRSAGFKDGREQFILEQKKERYPSWLADDRLSELDKEKDLEKDRDDLEPEKG